MKRKSKSGQFIKATSLIFLALFALGLVALTVVPRFIPWQKVKVQAEEKLSQITNHQISIDEVSFKLTRGIELKGITIANAKGFSSEPLLQDDVAMVKYRLLPLLFGKIAIKAIVLKRPRVVIEKNPNGVFNFSDMIKKKGARAESQPGNDNSTEGTSEKKLTKLPFDIMVSYIGIEDGTLIYRDQVSQQDLVLDAFNFKVNNLTFVGVTPIEVIITTTIAVMDQTIPLVFKTDWRFNYAQQQILLDLVRLNVPGIELSFAGKIKQIFSDPRLEMKGDCGLDFKAMLAELLPKKLKQGLPQDLAVDGPVQIAVQLAGPVNNLDELVIAITNELELSVQAAGFSIPLGLQGDLKLNDNRLTAVQDLKLPGMSAQEKLKMNLVAEGFKLSDSSTLSPKTMTSKIDWSLKAKSLNLAEVLALFPKKNKTKEKRQVTKKNQVSASQASEPDARLLIPRGLTMHGRAQVGSLRLGTITLGQMTVSSTLQQQVADMKVKLSGYDGQIDQQVELWFNRPQAAYALTASARQVNIEPLMNDLLDTLVAVKIKKPKIIDELKDKVAGRLTGKVAIKGQGLTSAVLQQQLTGSGEVTLVESRIRKMGFQSQLAQWLGNERFNQELPFDHTKIKFSINNQVVTVSEFIAESGDKGLGGDLRLTGQGRIKFEATFDHFQLMPRVNPRAARSISSDFRQYTDVLRDQHDWVVLPMILNGAIKKPEVKPDWLWIKKQAGKKIKQKTEKFISQEKKKATEQLKKNIEKEIKKLNLNNLFK